MKVIITEEQYRLLEGSEEEGWITEAISEYLGSPHIKTRNTAEWTIKGKFGELIVSVYKNSTKFRDDVVEYLYLPYDKEAFLNKHRNSGLSNTSFFKHSDSTVSIRLGARNEKQFLNGVFLSIVGFMQVAEEGDDWEKLAAIAEGGDAELALQIAKGQGLI
jgi:hypothetical protein